MGKFLESIGLIEGHDIITIGKTKASKNNLFTELLKEDKNIQNEVKELLEKEESRIFAIIKKKKIKGLYLFNVVEKNNEKILEHIKTIYTKEVKKETQNKYDEIVLKIAKDFVSIQQYSKVTFEDNIVQLDPTTSNEKKKSAYTAGLVFGFIFGWIVFDNILMGLVYAIIFTPIFSGIKVVTTKKRGRKKKNNNEK